MDFEAGRKLQSDEEFTESKLFSKENESIIAGESLGNAQSENISSNENKVPLEVFDLVKTISQIQLPKNSSAYETNLFKKLLSNKEVVVERKEAREYVVTDEKEKWLIIKKLSQRGRELSKDFEKDDENNVKINDLTLKCLESMIKCPRKSNDSLVFCKECNLFMKRSSFSGHNRFVHKKIRRYLCQTCGYAAHTGSILRQHIQAVHVGYTFECNKCSQKFNLLKRLRKHQELHHSKIPSVPEKKKICHYCGLAFFRLSYLKTHLLTHTEESPLQCQYCSRKFKFRWAMIQHERLHTGVKPYKCQYCGETFTQNRVRKSHENKVHAPAEETDEQGFVRFQVPVK